MADAEGVISALKLRHGLDRARCRGTPLFHVQLLLGCTAINLKRLATHTPEATSGAGAASAATAAAPTNASNAQSAPRSSRPASPPSPISTPWTIAVCLN